MLILGCKLVNFHPHKQTRRIHVSKLPWPARKKQRKKHNVKQKRIEKQRSTNISRETNLTCMVIKLLIALEYHVPSNVSNWQRVTEFLSREVFLLKLCERKIVVRLLLCLYEIEVDAFIRNYKILRES